LRCAEPSAYLNFARKEVLFVKDFKYTNSLLGVLLFLLGFWCFLKSGEYVPVMEMEGQIGAHVFPRLFSGALMFLSALMIFLDVKKFTKTTNVSFEGIGVVCIVSLLCFAFWYCIPVTGFLSVAILFVCLISTVVTRKIRLYDLFTVVLVACVIYFIFVNLLRVPLPGGFLI
jgi:hypothetical protein